MSEFFQRLLQEPSASGGDSLFLAAFGKHPGWNDHLDDFGLQTESLAIAKKLIYLQGLASQIDSAAWEELAPEKRLAEFNHLFLWTRGTGFLAGILWSSRDGKGRAKYPMVLCVHGIGLSPLWAATDVFPVLDELKTACQATTSAAEVVHILTTGRARLRNAVSQAEPPAGNRIPESPFAGQKEGLHRIFYEIRNQMSVLAPGTLNMRSPVTLPSRRLRVPAQPADGAALQAWSQLVSSQLDKGVPLLAIAARDAGFLDLIAGEPVPKDFFCLRASTKQLPLTTEIPYTLEPGFVTSVDLLVEDLMLGRETRQTIFGEANRSGGFSLFPWGSSTENQANAQSAPSDSYNPVPPVKTHAPSSLKWIRVAFILLGLLIIGLTLFIAAGHE